MKHILRLEKVIPFRELQDALRNVVFRGVYNTQGGKLRPYEHAKFSFATVYPFKGIGVPAEILIGRKRETLFTPQPTIYQTQIEITETVDQFLRGEGMRITDLDAGVQYSWEGRGVFHVLPPIVEKHIYPLRDGFIDLSKLLHRFSGAYVRDARGNLHHLGNAELHNFFIDEVSQLAHLDTLNSNAAIINYGLPYHGDHTFYIICDGAHRLDYALEKLRRPITVIVAEAKHTAEPLMPYYAFPVPLRPTVRLSSKKAEKMFYRLELDKIHLLNDFIKKVLHYDWEVAGLFVGKLRSNVEIY